MISIRLIIRFESLVYCYVPCSDADAKRSTNKLLPDDGKRRLLSQITTNPSLAAPAKPNLKEGIRKRTLNCENKISKSDFRLKE